MACQNPLHTPSLPSSSCKSYRSVVPPFPSLLLSPYYVSSSYYRAFSPPTDRPSYRAFSPSTDRHRTSSNFSLVLNLHHSYPHRPSTAPPSSPRILCKAAEYVFPDPIPEFAEAETSKFRDHLLERLSKKDIFQDSLEEIVHICTEILGNFLHTEYGGPGTLLVVPFVDMADTINERGLPGGPQAARAAVLWAQNHIDKDWKDWTGDPNL